MGIIRHNKSRNPGIQYSSIWNIVTIGIREMSNIWLKLIFSKIILKIFVDIWQAVRFFKDL